MAKETTVPDIFPSQQTDAISLRPRLHLTALFGWLNDPCAPGYDPVTNQYFLFHQWNPKGCGWGNMSWGKATSFDLVHWTRDTGGPALEPSTSYDSKGVFTGCFWRPEVVLPNIGIQPQSVLFYSSVQHLPFTWSEPYPRNSAGIAMATSLNGNKWTKSDLNPILRGEPTDLTVTGFRDPFVTRWKALDKALDCLPDSGLYAIVSGGIRGRGPTAFLYKIQEPRLDEWKYLGPLLDITAGYRSNAKWGGDFGINAECVNVISLAAGDVSHDFLLLGAEGGKVRPHQSESLRTVRWCLWVAGRVTVQKDIPVFARGYCGIFDHGCWYAANSFWDPIRESTIVWGWIPEEDVPLEYCKRKGWNGCLGVPREVFLFRLPNVKGALHSALGDISCLSMVRQKDGLHEVQTLGVRSLSLLSQMKTIQLASLERLSLPAPEHESSHCIASSCDTWDLRAEIDVSDGCTAVGIHLMHNESNTVGVTVTFNPSTEEIIVDRSRSNQDDRVDRADERGPHTLFTTWNPDRKAFAREKFRLHLICDGNVLEVFANDRFALATMVYKQEESANRVSLFAEGNMYSAVFVGVDIQAYLGNIFSRE